MAALTPKELFKYEWRKEVFLRKYTEEDTFELSGGKKVKLVINKAIVEAVKKEDSNTLKQLGILDTKGNHYSFGKLEKTKEFGGKGAGFGTTKEDIELNSLQKQIEDLKIELGKAYIPIRVGGKIYQVSGAATTPGTPKSDFHLLSNEGSEIVWISHKDGRTARDFQQWGGMTESPIQRHRETKAFVDDIIAMFGKELPKATTLARKIKDKKLKMMSVYGVDYGKKMGQQNVSILIQGPVKLKRKNKAYEFESNHVHFNGENIAGDFEPVMMAMYKGDRSNFNIKGARFAIQPLKSRKITQMI